MGKTFVGISLLCTICAIFAGCPCNGNGTVYFLRLRIRRIPKAAVMSCL